MATRVKKIMTIILVGLLGGTIMFGFFGCKDLHVKKYKVEYVGGKTCYTNAKEEYAAGEAVELYYPFIATDTDYSFTLDGEKLNYDYDEEKGFVIRFTMPEHDVKLECQQHNSMIYVPPTEEEADVMLIDSYRATVATVGGDGYDEIVLYSYDEDRVRLNVYRSRGGDETEVKYLVPREVVDKCMAVIEKHGMKDWNDREDTAGMTGALLVCKFRDGDTYIRVSSEAMPADGKAAFDEVESVLGSYVKDEYKVTD